MCPDVSKLKLRFEFNLSLLIWRSEEKGCVGGVNNDSNTTQYIFFTLQRCIQDTRYQTGPWFQFRCLKNWSASTIHWFWPHWTKCSTKWLCEYRCSLPSSKLCSSQHTSISFSPLALLTLLTIFSVLPGLFIIVMNSYAIWKSINQKCILFLFTTWLDCNCNEKVIHILWGHRVFWCVFF